MDQHADYSITLAGFHELCVYCHDAHD